MESIIPGNKTKRIAFLLWNIFHIGSSNLCIISNICDKKKNQLKQGQREREREGEGSFG